MWENEKMLFPKSPSHFLVLKTWDFELTDKTVQVI